MLIVCGLVCTTLQLLCEAILIAKPLPNQTQNQGVSSTGAHVLWPCSTFPQIREAVSQLLTILNDVFLLFVLSVCLTSVNCGNVVRTEI